MHSFSVVSQCANIWHALEVILKDRKKGATFPAQVEGLNRNGIDKNGGIMIDEGKTEEKSVENLGSAEKRSMQADADFARQLQAQMDVQESRGRNR